MKRDIGIPRSEIDSCLWINVMTRELRCSSTLLIARNRRELVLRRWRNGERSERIKKRMNKMMKIRKSVESIEESIEKSTVLGAPYPSVAVGEVFSNQAYPTHDRTATSSTLLSQRNTILVNARISGNPVSEKTSTRQLVNRG
jgi:hypothetical protein